MWLIIYPKIFKVNARHCVSDLFKACEASGGNAVCNNDRFPLALFLSNLQSRMNKCNEFSAVQGLSNFQCQSLWCYILPLLFPFSPSGRWDSLFDLNSYSHKPTNSFRITECNPVFTAYRLHVRIPFFFVILKSLRFLFF